MVQSSIRTKAHDDFFERGRRVASVNSRPGVLNPRVTARLKTPSLRTAFIFKFAFFRGPTLTKVPYKRASLPCGSFEGRRSGDTGGWLIDYSHFDTSDALFANRILNRLDATVSNFKLGFRDQLSEKYASVRIKWGHRKCTVFFSEMLKFILSKTFWRYERFCCELFILV